MSACPPQWRVLILLCQDRICRIPGLVGTSQSHSAYSPHSVDWETVEQKWMYRYTQILVGQNLLFFKDLQGRQFLSCPQTCLQGVSLLLPDSSFSWQVSAPLKQFVATTGVPLQSLPHLGCSQTLFISQTKSVKEKPCRPFPGRITPLALWVLGAK